MAFEINVVDNFGDTSKIGFGQPVVGMTTNFGTIRAFDGSGLIAVGSGSSQNQATVYHYEVFVKETEASNYGWPFASGNFTVLASSGDSIESARFQTRSTSHSGVYLKGDGTPTYI